MPESSEFSKSSQHGWCNNCVVRTGQKKFWQLFEGMCQDCHLHHGRKITSQKFTKPIAITPSPRKPKERTLKPPRASVESIKKVKKDEEKILLAALAESSYLGSFWIEKMASKLGWSYEQTRSAWRRIRRNYNYKFLTTPEFLLEQLRSCKQPISAYELSKSLSFEAAWIYQVLKRLAEQGKVQVIKCKQNLYYLELHDRTTLSNNT